MQNYLRMVEDLLEEALAWQRQHSPSEALYREVCYMVRHESGENIFGGAELGKVVVTMFRAVPGDPEVFTTWKAPLPMRMDPDDPNDFDPPQARALVSNMVEDLRATLERTRAQNAQRREAEERGASEVDDDAQAEHEASFPEDPVLGPYE
jgi:hypothetical protein